MMMRKPVGAILGFPRLNRLGSLFFLASLGCGIILYHMKYKVSLVEKNLRIVKAKIIHEREAIHILSAEWGYLNSPSRLQQLNEKLLHLKPVPAVRIKDLKDLEAPSEDEGVVHE